MDKYNFGEYFESKDENIFSEYKEFKAEQYYVFESAKSPKEELKIPENFNETERDALKNNKSKGQNINSIQEQKELIKSNISKINGIESTAAKIAVSTTSATTIVAAAVIAVSIPGGFLGNVANHIKYDIGMDYSAITINMDKILAENDQIYGLKAGDFTIEFPNLDEQEEIQLQSGTHTYLIPSLEPNKNYSYNLVCNSESVGSQKTYYSDSFTTKISSEPKGIYDEIHSNIVFDNDSHTATFNYSFYVSDYLRTIEHVGLFICDQEQASTIDWQNIIYVDENIDNYQFFKGTFENITSEKLYIYIVGYFEGDDAAQEIKLLEKQINIQYPKEWENFESKYAQINRENANLSATEIGIEVEIDTFNNDHNLLYILYQYDTNDNIINNPIINSLFVSFEQTMLSIYEQAYYGLTSYEYFIYEDDVTEQNLIYQSGRKEFNISQEYAGSFEVLSLADAEITYNQDSVEITVNPNFQTEDENTFMYTIQLIDMNGDIVSEQESVGICSFVLYDVENYEGLFFVYKETAYFAGDVHYYDSYNTECIPFSFPKFNLGDSSFNGQSFEIAYTLDMNYNYSEAYAEIYVNSSAGSSTITINNLEPSGKIAIDNEGEIADANISGILYFKDFQSSGRLNSLSIDNKTYSLTYNFNVEQLLVNTYNFGATTTPITIKFNYLLPSDYQIEIIAQTADAILFSNTIPVTEEYYFDSIQDGTDFNLEIKVYDTNRNQYGNNYSYSVSKSTAESNFTSPYMVCVNPGDALVTYNDDGTMNLYRKINFESDNPDIYYNAFIYGSLSTDPDTGQMIYSDCYDIIGRDKYAIIEDIPMMSYIFIYYQMFDYQGVSYIMYSENPSGTVDYVENIGYASMSYNQENDTTTISVKLDGYGMIDNRITCDGIDYQFTSFTDPYDSYPSLELSGQYNYSRFTIYFNSNAYNYDDYASEITLKGNKFRAIELTLNTL